jgi:high-affinity Fe2+/Pb2+ permease
MGHPAAVGRPRSEKKMKKLSFSGLMLGAVAGMAIALMFGKWIFWLGLGLAIGMFIGSISARHRLAASLREEARL